LAWNEVIALWENFMPIARVFRFKPITTRPVIPFDYTTGPRKRPMPKMPPTVCLLVAFVLVLGGCSSGGKLGKTSKSQLSTRGSNQTMMSVAPQRIRLGAGDGIGAAMFSQYAQARIDASNHVLAKR